MPGILCPDHSFELVWRGGGHYEHVFPRSCHLDQQWACVIWLPRDNGEHWAVTKSTTILTTKCLAPRNKEEHYPEVSGLTLLSEISVIECQLSSKERWTKPWDYVIFQGRTRIILTSCQFCLLIRIHKLLHWFPGKLHVFLACFGHGEKDRTPGLAFFWLAKSDPKLTWSKLFTLHWTKLQMFPGWIPETNT